MSGELSLDITLANETNQMKDFKTALLNATATMAAIVLMTAFFGDVAISMVGDILSPRIEKAVRAELDRQVDLEADLAAMGDHLYKALNTPAVEQDIAARTSLRSRMDQVNLDLLKEALEANLSTQEVRGLRGREAYQYVFSTEEFRDQCRDADLDPVLIARQIWRESSFRSGVVSSKNALGAMQITKICLEDVVTRIDTSLNYTWEDMGSVVPNITVGIAYMSYLQKRFNTMERALYGYVAGPTAAGQWSGDMRDAPYEVRNYITGIQG